MAAPSSSSPPAIGAHVRLHRSSDGSLVLLSASFQKNHPSAGSLVLLSASFQKNHPSAGSFILLSSGHSLPSLIVALVRLHHPSASSLILLSAAIDAIVHQCLQIDAAVRVCLCQRLRSPRRRAPALSAPPASLSTIVVCHETPARAGRCCSQRRRRCLRRRPSRPLSPLTPTPVTATAVQPCAVLPWFSYSVARDPPSAGVWSKTPLMLYYFEGCSNCFHRRRLPLTALVWSFATSIPCSSSGATGGASERSTAPPLIADLRCEYGEVWSYERLPVCRPVGIKDAIFEEIPVAIPWMTVNSKVQTDPHHNIPVCRNAMDLLTHDKITWRPYERLNMRGVPQYVVLSHFEICHRAPLQALEIVVGYFPDRCLPQFGMRQTIPRPPRLDLPTDTRNAWRNRSGPEYLITDAEEADPATDIYSAEYTSWYGVPRVFTTTLRYEEPRYEPTGYHEDLYGIYKSRCMNGATIAEDLVTNMINANVPPQIVAQALDLATILRAPVPDHFTEADDPTAATQTVPVRGPSKPRWVPKEKGSTSQPCHQSPEDVWPIPEHVGPSTDPVLQSSEPYRGSSEHLRPIPDSVPQSSEPRRWIPEHVLERSEPYQWGHEPITHLSEPTHTTMETEDTLGTSYPWGDPSTSLAMATGYSSYEMHTTPTPFQSSDPTGDIVNDFFSTPVYQAYGGAASSSYQYAPIQGMRPPTRAPVIPSQYFDYDEEELGFVRPSTKQQGRGHMHRQSSRPHDYAHDHAYGNDCNTR